MSFNLQIDYFCDLRLQFVAISLVNLFEGG